jgi:ATP-dependent exoDNAse (exonuclease V) beta subunit
MERWLQQQGCSERDAQRGSERVMTMLGRMLASESGRWVLAARQDALVESALAQAEDEGISRHVVDRSFVEDGARWIIDYKTATVGGDAVAHAERYRAQLERYARLFAAESLPVRMAIYFVAEARLVELP